MNEGNNVNGFNSVKYNVNDNEGNNERFTNNEKDRIADKLCEQLGNREYRAFYCKVAYQLSEAQIWSSLETAKKGKHPARYFTWLVKKQMS